ncbi:cation:proton antiporter [Streptomyces sp. NPDC059651]|uniref:cation:proton antiporter domain-containing protein n=1 Tax=Streptomyces sp. NPDC059651 TaxID=3346897 RepID=UPI00367D3A25
MTLTALPVEAIVLADVALALGLSAVTVRLIRRWAQPPVVAEIVAGIALGPTVLGLLPGDLTSVIFPPEARASLSAMAQFGLVLFMFLAGWELDLRRLRGSGRFVGAIAVPAMVVPFCMGGAAAAVAFKAWAPPQADPEAFVLYMATALSVTAFPVLARLIRDQGLSGTRMGATAMACAAICDVFAWCVLVIVAAVAGSGEAGDVVRIVSLTLLYAAVMVTVVQPLLRRALRSSTLAENRGAALAVVVVGVLLSSVATSWIGIHALFGAFAFGLVMPRKDRHGAPLMPGLGTSLEGVTTLLLPVFFVVTGLNVDIGGLGGMGLVTLVVVLVVAVAGKIAGTVLPARLAGTDWRDAGTLGVLMNTRGLTEIIVVQIGSEIGLVTAELFTVMVLMALLTTAMVGPLLCLLRGKASGPADAPVVPAAPGDALRVTT